MIPYFSKRHTFRVKFVQTLQINSCSGGVCSGKAPDFADISRPSLLIGVNHLTVSTTEKN